MKKILPVLAALMVATGVFAANPKVRGVVKNRNGESVGYSSVILTSVKDSTLSRGAVANAEGHFEVNVPSGDYRIEVHMLGYERYRNTASLTDNTDMGVITLNEEAVQIAAAVVRADMIRRKADGYIFNPAGSTVALGRNSLQLLSYAPGVWYDTRNGLTVNGKGGTKIMVNDRMLNLSGDELSAYLENIDAEKIKSIEVVPEAGSQYDASSTGGIIKITLKRQSVQGLMGSVGVNYNTVLNNQFLVRPTVNLDFRKNRLSLYTNIAYGNRRLIEHDREITNYRDNSFSSNIDLSIIERNNNFQGKLGAVYELTDRQSVGVDFDFTDMNEKESMDALGTIIKTVNHYGSLSRRAGKSNADRYNLSFNYKIKTDSLGSNLTIVADYMNNKKGDYYETYVNETLLGSIVSENTNNEVTDVKTDYYTVRADHVQYFGAKTIMEAGFKYSYTDMATDLRYANLENAAWVPDTRLSDNYLYREGVAAAYANLRASAGKLDLSGGLRVENTNLRPHSFTRPAETKNKNYTDLFPSLMLNYSFDKKKGNSVSASYRRRINRPGFSQLNPFRMQLNNYTFIVGNPDIKPSYSDSYALTFTMRSLYSLSLGIEDRKGAVAQMITVDPNNPEVMLYKHMNIDRVTNYFITAAAPVNIAKWWRMNLNAVFNYSENKLPSMQINEPMMRTRINNIFTLPKGYSLEFNHTYNNKMVSGNMVMKGQGFFNFDSNIKKSFFKNKLSTSLFVNNIFDSGKFIFSAKISDEKFTKELLLRDSRSTRGYGMTLRYNFNAGSKVKVNKVTAGNEEERSR